MRTGNVIRMEVMVMKMMDHKGALFGHGDHVLADVLGDQGVPCHGAQEHHVVVDLAFRERVEGLLIRERVLEGLLDRLDCGYHGFSSPFFI